MSDDNVVHVPFNPLRHPELNACYHAVYATLMEFGGRIPLAGALGVLELVKDRVLREAREEE